jgi:hypothetical protein
LFAVSGVAEAGEDVLGSKVGKVCEDFGLGHTRGEIGKDIVHGDTHSSDARFAAAFAGFEGDDVLVVHEVGLSCDGFYFIAIASSFLNEQGDALLAGCDIWGELEG